MDPYATLQVTRDAHDDVIAAAYRAMAMRHHPDRAGEHATGSMAAINVAWELIGTPEKRAAFDRAHRVRLVATSPGVPSTQTRPTRTGGAGLGGASRTWQATGPDGTAAAGPPPGRPSGSVLPFGRHVGWSLGEIARVDPGYLEWLEDRHQGRPFLAEIDALLRRLGRRGSEREAPTSRRRAGARS